MLLEPLLEQQPVRCVPLGVRRDLAQGVPLLRHDDERGSVGHGLDWYVDGCILLLGLGSGVWRCIPVLGGYGELGVGRF